MAERRCEKKEKRVSHGGTANTAFLEEVEKRFERCGRCVAVRKKRRVCLTAAQRARRFWKKWRRGLCAVVVVSL